MSTENNADKPQPCAVKRNKNACDNVEYDPFEFLVKAESSVSAEHPTKRVCNEKNDVRHRFNDVFESFEHSKPLRVVHNTILQPSNQLNIYFRSNTMSICDTLMQWV